MTLRSDVPRLALARIEELFHEKQQRVYRQTNRTFAMLMLPQWILGIVLALTLSPRSWTGSASTIHPHVWEALFLGGIIAVFPVLMALLRPGQPLTRYSIAIAQMLTSALLIHLRRADRDSLSRVRVAGVPGVLSRLASPGLGDRGGRAGSLPARRFLAAAIYGVAPGPSGDGWSTRDGWPLKTRCSSSRASRPGPHSGSPPGDGGARDQRRRPGRQLPRRRRWPGAGLQRSVRADSRILFEVEALGFNVSALLPPAPKFEPDTWSDSRRRSS